MNYLNSADLLFLSPWIILLFGALLILLTDCFFESCKNQLYGLTLLTFILAFFFKIYAPHTENILLTNWIKSDFVSHFFTLFFLLIGFLSACLASTFFKKFEAEKLDQGEYYFLLIAAVFGLVLIGSSADFLPLFLGLETLSISLYVLCGYVKRWNISKEAAIKYFLLGSFGTAFFLYGVALIYGATGTLNFDALLPAFQAITGKPEKTLFFAGISLVTLGLLFKAAIVPFHTWAPDVYEGSTTPVTAFMATGTKIGAFAAFIRIFLEGLLHFSPLWNLAMALLFVPAVIYANLVAIRQINLRRFFAYSGISHSAFLLIPLAASTKSSISSILLYLLVYVMATFLAFAVLTILDKEKRGLYLEDLKGLYFKSPLLAGFFTLSVLTLAGLPPTVGFLAKFYIFKAGWESGLYFLVIVGLLTAIFSAFYYLRIMSKMFTKKGDILFTSSYLNSSFFVAVICAVLLIFSSILPNFLFNAIYQK